MPVQFIKQSEATVARRTVYIYVVDGTGLAPYGAGAGGTARVLYPGAGTFVNTGTLVALTSGTGHYAVTLATADIATLGPVRVTFPIITGTALEAYADVQVVGFDPYDGTGLGLSRVDAAISSRSSHGTADVWAAPARTLTGTTGFGLAADQSAVTIGTANRVGTAGTLLVNADKTGYTAAVVSDKSGYSLAADQSAVTIGTVNRVGTLTVNADKTGYGLAADQSAVTVGTAQQVGTLTTNKDKSAYSLAADQSPVTIGTVNQVGTLGTLGTQAKADVNAEVVDALGIDTVAEPGIGAPASPATMKAMITYLYTDWRNKVTQTGTLRQVFNDAGTAIAQATVSDDGTIFTKQEYTSG